VALCAPRLQAPLRGDITCRLDRQRFARSRFGDLSWVLFVAALVLVCVGDASAQAPPLGLWAPLPGGGHGEKKSMLEARAGYMWGWNEIRLRDGDSPNLLGSPHIRPSKKEVILDSLALGLHGERFFTEDLAFGVQLLGNVPTENRTDFFFDTLGPDRDPRVARAWDTRARYLSGDLSLAWYLGLGGAPYRAGLVLGYRYTNFRYDSNRNSSPEAGTFRDDMHIHVPYVGIHYSHVRFAGTVVTLNLSWSVLALSRYDATRQLPGDFPNPVTTYIDGHSLTGKWFDSMLGWYVPVSSTATVGIFARYNYLELSGGATAKSGVPSTRFSLDSRHHLIFCGAGVTYVF